MAKKSINWKTKGMNRDISVSAFSPEFAFENVNLRLATNESNTMLSWVNERGTREITFADSSEVKSIEGTVVGTAVINHKLVLFTHDGNSIKQPSKVVHKPNEDKDDVDEVYPDVPIVPINPEEPEIPEDDDDDDSSGGSSVDPVDPGESTDPIHPTDPTPTTPSEGGGDSGNTDSEEGGEKEEGSDTGGDGTDTGGDNTGGGSEDAGGSGGTSGGDTGGSSTGGSSTGGSGGSGSNIPTSTTSCIDRIYVLYYSNTAKTRMKGTLLYKGNLGFSASYPLETMVDYESEYIQKVYWTDGLNQPRLINIAASSSTISKWNHQSGSTNPSLDYFFDFVPSFDSSGLVVKIANAQTSGGTFAPGVIQYCFTYINKYGQQSNVVYSSGLYYLSKTDRGASPTEKVSTVFNIDITGLDTTFDYVRLYSVHRSSVNDTPVVKLLEDLPIKTRTVDNTTVYAISYVDNGTTGSTVDPFELLYAGGREITALTMASKDNTLFLGNITQKNSAISSVQTYISSNKPTVQFVINSVSGDSADTSRVLDLGASNSTYFHKNTLESNSRAITTFKGGEWYRFGFQLQKKTGEWLDPIFINDVQNDKYPSTSLIGGTVNLTYAKVSDLNIAGIREAYNTAYSSSGSTFDETIKKIRPVIVYPNINDREVLCQGVLNPTVFNVEDRIDGTPYAQASWFFRPYHTSAFNNNGTTSTSNTVVDTDRYLDKGSTTKSDWETGCDKVSRTSLYDGNFVGFHNVFVMVGTIPSDSLYNRSKAVIYSSGGKLTSFPIQGLIVLSSDSSSKTHRCVFFSAAAFPTPYRKDGKNKDLVYQNITDIEYSAHPYKLCSTLSVDSNGISYYSSDNNQANSSDIYNFKFIAGYTDHADVTDTSSVDGFIYNICFKKVTASMLSNYSEGSPLVFKHFESLRANANYPYTTTTTNADGTTSTKVNSYPYQHNVEIQGARNTYSSVFEDKKDNPPSNNQFFIDQSIVTLNSPELEFDTNIQACDTDHLKLRIVGMIPITATASSHSIKAGSNMLRTNYDSTTSSTSSGIFGSGDTDKNIICTHNNTSAYKRLVAGALWQDVNVMCKTEDSNTKVTTSDVLYRFMVYPWQRTGSLNNDNRGNAEVSSLLSKKLMANLWFSGNTEYITGTKYDNIGVQIALTENAEVMNYRLPKQSSSAPDINYYANIDKVLVNTDGYGIYISSGYMFDTCQDPVSMKYKSTTHAVIGLQKGAEDSGIPILPYGNSGSTSIGSLGTCSGKPFWDRETTYTYSQGNIAISNTTSKSYGFLWLGELYKDVKNRFNGTENLLLNNWVPAGESKDITNGVTSVDLEWTEGDTYYQRYDCLKTYPFTEDDTNQIVEILSFMCETHVNLDGRYDRNRGMINNVNVRPTNFNLINPVYSQRNNFFGYRKLNTEDRDELKYPNKITYTKSKENGSDVDLWTNITLASQLDMDGDKGEVTSIRRLNNQLIAFQDSGIAKIQFNENTMLSTTQGVPVEIANSGKVQGKTYISNTIGCSNKWSISQTPMGIYFMDNNDKSIYLLGEQLNNISATGGFNSWCKQNLPSSDVTWDPKDYGNFVAYYDKLNQDVLFLNSKTALAYSERLGMFTSFYDYGGALFFENLDDTGVWVTIGNEGKNAKLWKHQAGSYCKFFGENKPYSMTLIGNQEPQMDKIFTNMEFRACVNQEGVYDNDTGKFTAYTPFDSLEAWDEYQHGKTWLSLRAANSSSVHSSLEKKFRIWRCDIPRDNYPLSIKKEDGSVDDDATEALLASEAAKGIQRFKVRPLDRMRNPWVYLKLEKKAAATGDMLSKTEVHDLVATYFG